MINLNLPDPDLIAEMAATIRIPCQYGDHPEIWEWLHDNDITFRFRNQWSDEQGQFASFTIPDEKERMAFLLRWA